MLRPHDGEGNFRMKIRFPNTRFSSLEFRDRTNLSEVLTVENSPILFGCRTGVCGTCLCRVEAADPGKVVEPSSQEQELIGIIGDGDPKLRLACQIESASDLVLGYVGLH